MATGSITKLPYIGKPLKESQKTYEIFVTATPDPVQKSEVVPLWIWVLAACAGALILLLLIYLLYKVSENFCFDMTLITKMYYSVDSSNETDHMDLQMSDSRSTETGTITAMSTYR